MPELPEGVERWALVEHMRGLKHPILEKNSCGAYVLHADHLATLAAERERLREAWEGELLSEQALSVEGAQTGFMEAGGYNHNDPVKYGKRLEGALRGAIRRASRAARRRAMKEGESRE